MEMIMVTAAAAADAPIASPVRSSTPTTNLRLDPQLRLPLGRRKEKTGFII
jgi:hypothetical protein